MLPNAVKKVEYKNVRDIDITSAKAKKKKLAQATTKGFQLESKLRIYRPCNYNVHL
jgi:hypothetical protein